MSPLVQFARGADARRLGAWVLGGLVLAVMTGPSGSGSTPTAGLTGSLLHPHVIGYVVFGAAMWALTTARARNRERITSASAGLVQLRERLTGDNRARYIAYLVLLVVAILGPQMFNSFWQEVLVDQIGIFVLMAIGLNVVVGYAGLLPTNLYRPATYRARGVDVKVATGPDGRALRVGYLPRTGDEVEMGEELLEWE